MKHRVIACLGKGGTGKTALSTMLGMHLIRAGKRPLFIDADPVGGIQKTLGIEGVITVADARNELVRIARAAGREEDLGERREDIEFVIMQVLREEASFGFIALGQNTSTGCFCSINTLLRRTLAEVVDSYDAIIIDAEAGLEQVYRQVVEKIDFALMVTDPSKRGVDTCVSLKKAIAAVPAMEYCTYMALFNKTDAVPSAHITLLESEGIQTAGIIPVDAQLADFDARGESLCVLPVTSPAYGALEPIVKIIFE